MINVWTAGGSAAAPA